MKAGWNVCSVTARNEKMVFGTGHFAIQQIVLQERYLNIQSGIKEYGMEVTKLFCPFGSSY